MNAMPEILDDEVEATFTYEQLSDRAKDRVRDSIRNDPHFPHDDWWDCAYEDAYTIAGFMGIEIDTRREKRRDGSIRDAGPDIMFSGFWSQGDGACFNGRWRAEDATYENLCKLIDHAPNDTELHEIAEALAYFAHDLRHFPDSTARCKHSGNYCHSGYMDVECEFPEPDWLYDLDDDHIKRLAFDAVTAPLIRGMEIAIIGLMRDFADWIYDQLESEYDSMMEDEYIDDYIMNNMEDTLFDEDGNEI